MLVVEVTMSVRDLGVGLLCGVLLGAWVGWTFEPNRPWRSPSLTGTARAATVVRSAPAPCPDSAPPDTSVDAVIAAQDQQIRDLSDLAFGRPLVWPYPWQQWLAEGALEEAVATCAPGLQLLETDCAEPPCLAAFDLDDDEHDVSDLCPDLPNLGYTNVGRVTCPDGSEPRVQIVKVRSGDYRSGNELEGLDYGENVSRRIEQRTQDLLRAVVCP